MSDTNLAPVCGLYCGRCHHFNEKCAGCGNETGMPFWTEMMPAHICPLYDCCRNGRKLEHCGLCEDFPCSVFLELRDPSISDEEFKASLASRQRELKRRAEIGTLAWLNKQSSA